MTNNMKLRFMKVSCWAGILADALWSIALAFPGVYGLLVGKPDFDPGLDFRAVMNVGAIMLLAWTVLLIWVLRNPVERKAVFLITAYPITTCIFLNSLYNVVFGSTLLSGGGWIMAKTLFLTIMFTTSYIFGCQLKKNLNSTEK